MTTPTASDNTPNFADIAHLLPYDLPVNDDSPDNTPSFEDIAHLL